MVSEPMWIEVKRSPHMQAEYYLPPYLIFFVYLDRKPSGIDVLGQFIIENRI
jgi:hypothetical protein